MVLLLSVNHSWFHPKYSFALLKHIFSIVDPIKSMSFGRSPLSISLPNKSQRIRRKYSCLGKDKKLLESVSIPTNRLIRSEEHTSELQSRENLVCRLL